jgi:hypothetical protein
VYEHGSAADARTISSAAKLQAVRSNRRKNAILEAAPSEIGRAATPTKVLLPGALQSRGDRLLEAADRTGTEHFSCLRFRCLPFFERTTAMSERSMYGLVSKAKESKSGGISGTPSAVCATDPLALAVGLQLLTVALLVQQASICPTPPSSGSQRQETQETRIACPVRLRPRSHCCWPPSHTCVASDACHALRAHIIVSPFRPRRTEQCSSSR